jgi:hypothetical protein
MKFTHTRRRGNRGGHFAFRPQCSRHTPLRRNSPGKKRSFARQLRHAERACYKLGHDSTSGLRSTDLKYADGSLRVHRPHDLHSDRTNREGEAPAEPIHAQAKAQQALRPPDQSILSARSKLFWSNSLPLAGRGGEGACARVFTESSGFTRTRLVDGSLSSPQSWHHCKAKDGPECNDIGAAQTFGHSAIMTRVNACELFHNHSMPFFYVISLDQSEPYFVQCILTPEAAPALLSYWGRLFFL